MNLRQKENLFDQSK